MAGPLEGIRVVDASQGYAGPYCAMALGDGGAQVTKVEPLDGDDARGYGPPFVNGVGAQFLAINRNKQGVALDLATPEGREAFLRLIREADVLVSDLSPAQREEQGLRYEDLESVNPRLVHCCITPFGEDGPMANLPGAELPVQTMSDYTNSLGAIGEAPVRLGTDVANINAGGQAVQAIVAALLQRERTGEGQQVSVSMFGTLLHMRGMMWTSQSDTADDWWGFHQDTYIKAPDHGYRTKDGSAYMQLGAQTEESFDALIKQLGIPESVKDDPRWAGAGANVGGGPSRYGWEVHDVFERAFADKTTDEVGAILEPFGGSVFPLNSYSTLFEDPQVEEIGMVRELSHPEIGDFRVPGIPWLFSETVAEIQSPPPLLGEHTDEVLARIGYSAAEIEALREADAVR